MRRTACRIRSATSPASARSKLTEHAAAVPMRITLVDQNTYYTYLPFLPEVAGGHIAPKDVTVELRPAALSATCAYKCHATHYDVVLDGGGAVLEAIAWSYE